MSYQTYSPASSGVESPGKPPLLKFEDLTPQSTRDGAPSFTTHQVDHTMSDQLRGRLTELRDENSSLVSQSHRLLGELEDTSHQLLMANKKIDSLNLELAEERQRREASTAEHPTTADSAHKPPEASAHTRRLQFTSPGAPDRLSSLLGNPQVGGRRNPPDHATQGGSVTSKGPGSRRGLQATKEQEEETLREKLKQSIALNEELRSFCAGHDRERAQWRREQQGVKEQVEDLQEERRRLMDSLSFAEERVSGQREVSHPLGSSMQSWASLDRLPPRSNPLKTSTREALFSSTYTSPSEKGRRVSDCFRPSASEGARDGHYHGNGGFKSLPQRRVGSSEYLHVSGLEPGGIHGIVYSSRGPDFSSLPAGNVGYSVRGSGLLPSPGSRGNRHAAEGSGSSQLWTKLEAAETKLRQYEAEVQFLERELKQKSDQAQHHISELSSLQHELSVAREQARLDAERTKGTLEGEVDKVKRTLSLKVSELEVQLDSCRLQVEQSKEESERLRGELRQAQALLRVAEQGQEEAEERLCAERDGHTHTVQRLSSEVDQGSSHMAQMEKSLEQCQGELQEHLLRAQEEAVQQERVAQLHQKEIASLTEQLSHCKAELRQHYALVKTVQKELEAARDEVSVQRGAGERLTGEVEAYKELLKGRDAERTQLKADIMTLETKLKASHDERVRKEREIQRQMKGMENKYGEELRGLNHTREKCKEFERSCSQLEVVRGTLERRVTALGVENEELRAQLDAAERKERELVGQWKEAEGRATEGEVEMQSTVSQLQQEVARRAQQVAELDTLLRNHQADTAARRLQLERALAQRQADLRSRTQEVEDLTERLREMERALEQSKLDTKGISSDALQKMEEKVEEIYRLQSSVDQLKREAGSHKEDREAMESKLEKLQTELVTKQEGWMKLEQDWAKEKKKLGKEIEQMKKEREAQTEQYASQLKNLQDSHAQMLSSRDQEGAAHRLQMQRVQEQDRQRGQETVRIQAQVAALSSELAAERRVVEEAQQQLALARAEAARYQAQASSLQRALSLNNYTSHIHGISTQASPMKFIAAPVSEERGFTSPVTSPPVSQPSGASLNLPQGGTNPSVMQHANGPSLRPQAAAGVVQDRVPPHKEPGSPGMESVMSDLAEFQSLPPNLTPPSFNPPKTTPTQNSQFTGSGWSPRKKGDIIDV